MSSYCSNCLVYGWPYEGVTHFRCSNCKFIHYCSPECQKEHWVKVHKKHCKTLAGKVETPLSMHLPDSCPGCKEEKELGEETINLKECPAWGCLIGPGGDSVPVMWGKCDSAVKSGEMVRQFPSRNEHTVFVMQQIIYKLTRTKSRLAEECQMDWIFEALAKKRMNFMVGYHDMPLKSVERCLAHNSKMHDERVVLLDISKVSRTLGNESGDHFLAWETFKLLTDFLMDMIIQCKNKNVEKCDMKNDMPREEQELLDELGTSGRFEETWDSVLFALKSITHHYDLLDILCGGSRDQKCDHCQKSIVIKSVYGNLDWDGKNTFFEKPFVTFRRKIFSCTAADCQKASKQKEIKFINEIILLLNKVEDVLKCCDYCFMSDKKMYMCLICKTKIYCSEECQQLDWDQVHRKICNKGEVRRKVKNKKMENLEID